LLLIFMYMAGIRSDGILAYIPNADDGTISVIDTKTDMITRTLKVDSVLSDGIEASKDGKWIYAGNYSEGELLVIEAETGEIKQKIATGKNLHGIDMTPDGKYLYLASGDFKEGKEYNYITVVETGSHKVVKEIPTTSKSPSHIDFSRDGSLAYVANILSNDISLISTETYEIIATIPVGTIPNEVEPSADDKFLYVANVTDGTVSIVDLINRKEIETIKAGEGTHGLALSDDGTFLFASNRTSNDLIKLNLGQRKIESRVLTGKTANHVSMVPGTNKLYVTNKDSNDLTVVDAKTMKILSKINLGKTPHEISFAPGN
ncbi:MAG TPA: hypothetical protein DCR24_04310, partial [Bacillus bacterium]|nr:hypothetical protein [Bacillus sp. (in: firmicutes)]